MVSRYFDIHPHVISDDEGAYPPAPLFGKRSDWSQERPCTVETLIAAMDEAGVDKAAVVHSSTTYGFDNSYVVDACKDQKEIWPDQSPSITIYTGQEVHNGPPQRPVYAPDHHVVHQACPDLATYLIKAFQNEGFDLNDLQAWPENVWMERQKGPRPDYPVVPHAYSFVYHQIMGDQPPPHVPVLFNLFYPPTQPSMQRCIAFGRVLRAAIEAWPQDIRVAVIASGGLSHFVNDEEFDRDVIGKLAAYDYDGLAAIPDGYYQSGTSEVKIYSIVMMALQATGAKMTLVDYVPCWRTPAGTGEGMGFMYWDPTS